MADVELVIKMPEDEYNIAKYGQYGNINVDIVRKAIRNGTPLEKHDEEVIKDTVESIWGKPPYTELLEKIRAEIVDLFPPSGSWMYGEGYGLEQTVCEVLANVLAIIDKYAEREET